jgi:exodeoxyribonuclease VII small subunit
VSAPENQEQTFEAAEKELATIVDRLEHGEASLDEAIALWERGEQLYRFCLERLDAAQGKVEELAERVAAQRPPS